VTRGSAHAGPSPPRPGKRKSARDCRPVRAADPRQPSPRSPSCPAGCSHLARGQGPGCAEDCARGGGPVCGAGCRHFRSSPSLLSTCCCVGPAGQERRTRQPPWASGHRVPPPPPRPPARPGAPVRRCATSLLGPLVMVYMVCRPARRPPQPDPALSAGSTLLDHGHGPFKRGGRAERGGAARTRPPLLKGQCTPG
jgi:hypothetical protein